MESATEERPCCGCLEPVSSSSGAHDLRGDRIADMFYYCTSIQVGPRGGWMCAACYPLLLAACRFKQRCVTSHRTLAAAAAAEAHESEDRVPEQMECFNLMQEKNILRKKSKHLQIKGLQVLIVKSEEKDKNNTASVKLEQDSPEECGLPASLQHRHRRPAAAIRCDVCARLFSSRDSLRRHTRQRHACAPPTRPLTCAACGAKFASARTLRRHRRQLHAERSAAICHVCGRAFKSSVILQGHLETHKENRKRSHPCAQCNKSFFSPGVLATHVARRHTGRRFLCHLCSFPFADKYSLGKHLLRHAGVKPHRCDLCHNAYSSRSCLAEHRRTHTGERPYACDLCAKCFVSRKRLLDHRRTHTGERPHRCARCHRAFVQRGTLTRHMRVHDKVSPTAPPPSVS